MKSVLSALWPGGRSGVRILADYRAVDRVFQGYLVLVALLVLAFHRGRVDDWPALVAAHLLAVAAIHLLIRRQADRPDADLLGVLRCFYPILLYTALYRETALLNRMFVPGYLDRFFLALEERLFGFQPAVRFMELLPSVLLSEILYLAYFSYYLMILGVGIALFLRQREWFFRYVTVLSVVLLGCYLAFIFLPVVGPPLLVHPVPGFPGQEQLPFFPLAYPQEVTGGPFFQLMGTIYRHFEGPGGAFPSSHVAAALCTLVFSWRYLKRFRWFHLVLVVLLSLATVYCRYHYAVDVAAGALAAALLIPLGEYLYRRRP